MSQVRIALYDKLTIATVASRERGDSRRGRRPTNRTHDCGLNLEHVCGLHRGIRARGRDTHDRTPVRIEQERSSDTIRSVADEIMTGATLRLLGVVAFLLIGLALLRLIPARTR